MKPHGCGERVDIRIGTAGWSVPRQVRDAFPAGGTALTRYAARFDTVEINSSFYRPHRPSTYARWAESVPDGFRFAVKVPREITHTRRLVDGGEPLATFLSEIAALEDHLGPLLVQLPPSLVFDAEVARAFCDDLRNRFRGAVAFEPRHASWFEPDGDALLRGFEIARVAADPARVPAGGTPGGWPGFAYYRLHGSPRVYYSAYPPETITALAETLATHRESGTPVWCIYDNTALGAAADNALSTQASLRPAGLTA
jgi:uncharacterized protein YecE (DUF72 family)